MTKPGETASTLAQVFLGVRIACAECHHHPFDRWSQDRLLRHAGFLHAAYVRGQRHAAMLLTEGAGPGRTSPHRRDDSAHAAGRDDARAEDRRLPGDRRPALADWLTRPDNPWFARNLANRVWAHFLGRGLVEPVDDVRDTNPPSNPELLDALARHLVESKYDLRAADPHHHRVAHLPAVVEAERHQRTRRAELLAGLFKRHRRRGAARHGVPDDRRRRERFAGVPAGHAGHPAMGQQGAALFPQAVRPADAHQRLRMRAHPRAERRPGTAPAQLPGDPDHGWATKAAQSPACVKRLPDDEPLVEELYLTFYSRLPTEKEKKRVLDHLTQHKDQRRQAVEDVAWSLINTMEFVFNH